MLLEEIINLERELLVHKDIRASSDDILQQIIQTNSRATSDRELMMMTTTMIMGPLRKNPILYRRIKLKIF